MATPANSRNLTNPRQSTANLRDLRGPRSPHSLNKITLGNIIHARVRSTCCGELYSSGEKQGRRNFGIPSVSIKKCVFQPTANLRSLRSPRSLSKVTLGNIIHARVRSTCCGELYSSGEKQGRRNFGIPSVSTKSVRVFRVSTSKSCI